MCGDGEKMQDTILKYIDKYDHSVLSGGEVNQGACREPSESSYSDTSVAPDGRFICRSVADEVEFGVDFGEPEEEDTDTASSSTSGLGNGEGKEKGKDKSKDKGKDKSNGKNSHEDHPEASAAPQSPTRKTLEKAVKEGVGESNSGSESRLSGLFTVQDLLACRTACPRSYMQATDAIIGKYKVQAKSIAGHGHADSAKETELLQRERRLRSSMLQLAASRRLPSFVQQIVACHEAKQAEKYNKPGCGWCVYLVSRYVHIYIYIYGIILSYGSRKM